MHHLALLALLQQIQLAPFPAEVGEPVAVRVALPAGGAGGVAVEVEGPDGGRRSAGTTDASGGLSFTPALAGGHRFTAVVDGVRLVARMEVLPARRRWPYAVACVPLGLLLLWRLLRTRALSPGPSRPGP